MKPSAHTSGIDYFCSMQRVSPVGNQLFSILALIGFLALVLFGLFSGRFTSNGGFYALFVPAVIFFLVIVYKLSVWNVVKEENRIVLSNFFGIYKVVLDVKSDILSVKGSVIRSARHMPFDDRETGQFFELKTTKGTFRFSSEDYGDFDELTNLLFSDSPKLAYEYGRSLKSERKNHRKRLWLYVLIAIGMIIVISILKR